jgi:hypothetical protein
LLEFVQGGAEGAIEGVDAALQALKRPIELCVNLAVNVGFGQLALAFEFADAVVPEPGFDAAEAAQHPFGAGQGIDEGALFGSSGLEAGVVLGVEAVEIGGGFAGDLERIGFDPGFQGIHAGGDLAVDRARAGGFQGVEAVGLDLAKG